MPQLPLPTAAGVLSAASILTNKVVRTPILESTLLNAKLGGGRLLIKAESLQTTGSFKYRGALHRLIKLREEDPSAANRGVVAFSSGNFGQALAAAATTLDIRCAIVSPHDAPSVKLNRIAAYGADLRISTALEGTNREAVASALAMQLSKEEGFTLLHPFDDVHVIHGQGTIGVEFLEQAQELLNNKEGSSKECTLDSIVVPTGGGGMVAGINLAVDAHQGEGSSRKTKVMTVEPTGYDDHSRSYGASQRLSLAEIYTAESDDSDSPSPSCLPLEKESYPIPSPRSKSKACDALMAAAPGQITWSINGPRLSGAVAVKDDESVANAMKVAFDYYRLVLEPSGALGLAAVLEGLEDSVCGTGGNGPLLPPGRVVGVIACGGNTDLDTYSDMVGYQLKSS